MAEKKEEKEVITHRVGSVTFGVTLVAFGILFLMHTIIPAVSYTLIFHLWPCIFILLGIEVLLGNRCERKFIYDKTAIILTVILAFFAMGMAVADFSMQQYGIWQTSLVYSY